MWVQKTYLSWVADLQRVDNHQKDKEKDHQKERKEEKRKGKERNKDVKMKYKSTQVLREMAYNFTQLVQCGTHRKLNK